MKKTIIFCYTTISQASPAFLFSSVKTMRLESPSLVDSLAFFFPVQNQIFCNTNGGIRPRHLVLHISIKVNRVLQLHISQENYYQLNYLRLQCRLHAVKVLLLSIMQIIQLLAASLSSHCGKLHELAASSILPLAFSVTLPFHPSFPTLSFQLLFICCYIGSLF